MKAKQWTINFIIMLILFLSLLSGLVIYIDPYFHYHKPLKEYSYTLENQRYQNNGVIRHFDYDAVITGTSMTENFKTSEMNKLFNVNSIKVPFSGGSYYELNNQIKTALSTHKVKYVVRCLDYHLLIKEKDLLRTDMGDVTYPLFLYNNNPLDDVQYVLNKEVVLENCIPMIINRFKGIDGGITSFDEYSNWMSYYSFSKEAVLGDKTSFTKPEVMQDLTSEEKEMVIENVEQNVIDLAKEYPDTTFYYFFPPWSVAYWGSEYENGTLDKSFAAEKIAVEMILECDNIKLFSFNMKTEITTDLDNYKDGMHYGEWINSDILRYMKEDKYRLTKDNYIDFLYKQKSFYENYDYNSLFNVI